MILGGIPISWTSVGAELNQSEHKRQEGIKNKGDSFNQQTQYLKT